MDLIFEKKEAGQDPVWVAEFEVTGDFNLHIEGVYEGNVKIFQKGVQSGEYARSHGATPNTPSGRVYDYDLAALVYPKYIKVECATEVTRAVVLPEGVAIQKVDLIEFSVDDTSYQAERGMTWGEFVESKYNDGDFSVDGSYVTYQGYSLFYSGANVSKDTLVDETRTYYTIREK